MQLESYARGRPRETGEFGIVFKVNEKSYKRLRKRKNDAIKFTF